MLNKKIFFQNHLKYSKAFHKNFKKTKKIFKNLKYDIKNFKLPLLKSYEKNYKLDFSPSKIKKFSNYKNIIIIGMGGSILGTKSIYSFFKEKIKKNFFFVDNLDPNLYLQIQVSD